MVNLQILIEIQSCKGKFSFSKILNPIRATKKTFFSEVKNCLISRTKKHSTLSASFTFKTQHGDKTHFFLGNFRKATIRAVISFTISTRQSLQDFLTKKIKEDENERKTCKKSFHSFIEM